MEKQWSEVLEAHPEMFHDVTIVDLFHIAAAYNPEKTALAADDCLITYRELERESSLAAAALIQSGAGRGDIISVETGRCAEAVVAFLAAWKAGCAFIYLASGVPGPRNDECRRQCGIKYILDKDFIRHAISMGGDPEEVKLPGPGPDDLAVIIYTSGSTGHPKGVRITHRNLTASVSNFPEIGFESNDRYGCFANFMFIAGIYDLSVALAIGAELHLIPGDIRKDIHRLDEFYHKHQLTVTFLPPIMAVKYQELDGDSPLRILLVGSEPARNLRPAAYRIINVYASSECCAVACHYTIRDARKWYPIGKPVKTLNIRILDDNANPVPAGSAGELCVAGEQVAAGYVDGSGEETGHFISIPSANGQKKHWKKKVPVRDS